VARSGAEWQLSGVSQVGAGATFALGPAEAGRGIVRGADEVGDDEEGDDDEDDDRGDLAELVPFNNIDETHGRQGHGGRRRDGRRMGEKGRRLCREREMQGLDEVSGGGGGEDVGGRVKRRIAMLSALPKRRC
jgi:hypothetical protein